MFVVRQLVHGASPDRGHPQRSLSFLAEVERWGEALRAGPGLHRGRLSARTGAIVVFKRPPNPAHGHVGFYVGSSGPNSIMVLGGNQGNEVNRRAKKKSLVLGYIWPKGYALPEDGDKNDKPAGKDWATIEPIFGLDKAGTGPGR